MVECWQWVFVNDANSPYIKIITSKIRVYALVEVGRECKAVIKLYKNKRI